MLRSHSNLRLQNPLSAVTITIHQRLQMDLSGFDSISRYFVADCGLAATGVSRCRNCRITSVGWTPPAMDLLRAGRFYRGQAARWGPSVRECRRRWALGRGDKERPGLSF